MEESEKILLNHARSLIRSSGFMSTIRLVTNLANFWYDESGERDKVDFIAIINKITDNKDYRCVEYTTEEVKDFRVKDLFYYMPE
ncbi:MAG: hypothetical protein ACTSW7_01425 [Candidatus Thorarchaeota archaeon]|nr:hypothetical protein [Thermoplasmatales archaeon]